MIDEWTIIYLATFTLSMFFAGIIIPKILLIAFRRKLFDKPDKRKIHHSEVPRLGGLAFAPVIIFVMAFILGFTGMLNMPSYYYLTLINGPTVCLGLCCLLMMYLLGMADDLIGVRYRSKFIFEILSSILLMFGGLGIANLKGLFWLFAVPWWFGYPLTILLVVFVTNAINLIDGIDGLASGLSAIAFIIYGGFMAVQGEYFYACLAFAAVGVLVPFFYYNVFGKAQNQTKIFMGDTGSLTIGLLISFIGLKIWQMSAVTTAGLMPSYLIVIISPLIIPCFDVVRVFLLRLRHHNNPFLPDKNHIHHKLLDSGMKQRSAMISIVAMSLFICVGNTLLSFLIGINIILIIDIVVLIIWNVILDNCIKRRKLLTAA